MTPIIITIILLALIFDFLNGIHDSSNIVATMIASKAFSPRTALGMTAVANFCGPFIFGVAVAETIGHEVVAAETISVVVILAALFSAILWNLLTWYLGFPSSSSHALVGGLIGSVVIGAGWNAILIPGLLKILLTLMISPIIGLLFGYLILKGLLLLSWNASPKVNTIFKRSQVFTAIALALSHGTNDAQKTMGIITLALLTGGLLDVFIVPLWVIVACAAMIALGTAVGGWKLIRTLGGKFYLIKPIDGFASQFASAVVILGASLVGGPVSTTQVVSSSIMGVGAAERMNKVRWGVAQEIAIAWMLTIPATALVAAGLYWIISQFIS
ncbi:MAG: inorganic phosphate transporter [Chloroflexi bacterium RBG_16_47_49]|nr:MAG: inorganic phosphate transporter [Chloroflexi bacterium RBG_16_47_49]